MASYVAMQPPGSSDIRIRTVFVRDGFSWIAFLFPPVWLLWHRLFVETLLYLAAAVVLATLVEVLDLQPLSAAITLLLSLYVGLEGPALRMGSLSRRGWRQAGVVDAASRDDAEVRFFGGPGALAAAEPLPRPVTSPVLRPSRPGPALGLFDYPGKR
jgi:hypothetical protein